MRIYSSLLSKLGLHQVSDWINTIIYILINHWEAWHQQPIPSKRALRKYKRWLS